MPTAPYGRENENPADSAFSTDPFDTLDSKLNSFEAINAERSRDQQEIVDLVARSGRSNAADRDRGFQETKSDMENDLTFEEVVGNNSIQPTNNIKYVLPPVALLSAPAKEAKKPSESILARMAKRLEDIFANFKVEVRVTNIIIGPTVTRYEATPMLGVKISNVKALEQDIALNLGVKSVRVITIPGEGMIGIEAYNDRRVTVTLSDILAAPEFAKDPSPTLFGLGKNIAGTRVVADLRNMPHLLIAGTTGSGKSVCINTILLSLLFRAKPDELKFILIDPKVVELAQYNDIPHLLLPVVTEPERAAIALSHAVSIMEKRYRMFTKLGVRDVDSFNEKLARMQGEKDEEEYEYCPKIIIVIDELADLMMVASTKVQESISRLAQKARAAGIHLIVATQQPLSSILTSIIKANIPSRIAFAVSSAAASRVIMDKSGAERLLGNGDMLFSPIGSREPKRIQGAYVSDAEIKRVLSFIKRQKESEYEEDFVETVERGMIAGHPVEGEEEDALLPDAIEMVIEARKASTSLLQRRFRIGYNRAARLVDIMEEQGIVGPPDGARPREVLIDNKENI
jgi:S-DNA-T family DNA segregation ATPase FtsK/SpoIIIE